MLAGKLAIAFITCTQ